MIRLGALGLGLLASACTSNTVGTIRLKLTTAPESAILDSIATLRVTLTAPHQVIEEARTSTSFDFALEADAHGEVGTVIVEGFDTAHVLVATGSSPPFAASPLDAAITVYVAPPLSIGGAPETLASPRTAIAAAPLAYGGILVGGSLADATASTAVEVYNAYNHSLAPGLALPEARVLPALATTAVGVVYIAGGTETSHVVRTFDTTVAPSGAYGTVGEAAVVGPSGTAVAIGTPSAPRFLVAAAAPYVFDATTVTARPDLPALHAAASVVTATGERIALVATLDGLARFRADTLVPVAGTTGLPVVALAALPDGSFLALLADRADVVRVDAETGVTTTIAGALSELRGMPSLAVTTRYVVIASATSADVLDATSLARVVTLPATMGQFALALPNEQVLLGGALDGTPSDRLELFTPPPPPAP